MPKIRSSADLRKNYNELQKGLDDIAAGRTLPAEEVFAMLRRELEE